MCSHAFLHIIIIIVIIIFKLNKGYLFLAITVATISLLMFLLWFQYSGTMRPGSASVAKPLILSVLGKAEKVGLNHCWTAGSDLGPQF